MTSLNNYLENPSHQISKNPSTEKGPPAKELPILPLEIWTQIGEYVATADTPALALKNISHFAQASKTLHDITKIPSIQKAIAQHLKDDALMKIWNSGRLGLSFTGPKPTTLKEIKAWFEDPANSDELNTTLNMDLSELGLKVIPSHIKKFTQMRFLDLSHNKLSEIHPLTFRGLTQLQELDLSHNQLRKIHLQAFSGLTELKKLYLSYNELKEIHPKFFYELVQLKKLSLSHNPLKPIYSTVFKGLIPLEETYLSEKKLSACYWISSIGIGVAILAIGSTLALQYFEEGN